MGKPGGRRGGPSGSRFISLGTKAAVPIAVVLALTGTVVTLVLVEHTRREIVNGKTTAASMVADLLASSVAPAVDFGDTQSLQETLDRLTANQDVVYAGVWPKGALAPVAEFRRTGAARPEAPDRDALALAGDSVTVLRLVKNDQGAKIGSMSVRFSLGRENARIARARRTIAALITVLTAGIATFIFVVARHVVIAPLRQLTAAARRLELGSVRPVPVGANDEIGRLGRDFNAMAEAIADRERRLATLNRELTQLIDNMRQGIVVFRSDGNLVPVISKRTEEIFGQAALQQGRIQELLFPDPQASIAAEAFDQWVQVASGAPTGDWEELASLAPTRVILRAGAKDEKVLALDFRPIDESGRVDRIMMLASDETHMRRLERTVKEREEEHERQMAAMRRLVAGGGQLLVSVLGRARERLAACGALLGGAGGSLEALLVDSVSQHAHSIKGEARAFDLAALDAAASELEDFLAIVRGRLRAGQRLAVDDVREELKTRLDATTGALSRASAMLVEASPIGPAVLDQVTVRRGDVKRLLALAAGRGDEIARVAVRIASRPFGEALFGLVDAAPRWAAREGKRVALDVEGREVLVPPGLADALPDVLMHLVRNALAHGIEPVAERVAAGKPDLGVVRLVCSEGPNGPEVVVDDDGRGLDVAAIRTHAQRLGLDRDQDVSRLAFAPGLSTAQGTGLAGQGVGLGAVAADLAAVGYAASLVSSATGLRVHIHPVVSEFVRSDRSAVAVGRAVPTKEAV